MIFVINLHLLAFCSIFAFPFRLFQAMEFVSFKNLTIE